jgi:mRNA-degrading endonuclease toxin of MazEF toxin-antitoxin module
VARRGRLRRAASALAGPLVSALANPSAHRTARPRPPAQPPPGWPETASPDQTNPLPTAYPGDYPGRPDIVYAPEADHDADPGEVVWAWTPYEEDHRQGKTRPVLVIGYDQGWLLAVFLSSTDHDRDAAQEASQGRFWVKVGRGSWDSRGRTSYARVDRILRIAPASLTGRAERLDQSRFERVAAGISRHWAD